MLNYVMKMDLFFNVIKLKAVYMLWVEYTNIHICNDRELLTFIKYFELKPPLTLNFSDIFKF
jgi:hypothetical protein